LPACLKALSSRGRPAIPDHLHWRTGNDVVLTRVATPASTLSSITSLSNRQVRIEGLGIGGVIYPIQAASISTRLSSGLRWQRHRSATASSNSLTPARPTATCASIAWCHRDHLIIIPNVTHWLWAADMTECAACRSGDIADSPSGGTHDNSQHLSWFGRRPEAPVPSGTAEGSTRLCHPSGLVPVPRLPSAEAPGYFRSCPRGTGGRNANRVA